MSTGGSRSLGWAAPALVGIATAMAAEVGSSLLLYAGPGLARSISTLLATAALALGLGLWTAPRHGPDVVDRLRRRWIACLFAYLAAATFGVLWSLPGALPQARWTQAAGICFLIALPLFTSGTVWGGLAQVAGSSGRVGGFAALGAAVGFAGTGLLLPRTPLPGALLLTCLVFLSLGGMLFGLTLAGSTATEVVAERASSVGSVRVEDVVDVDTGLAIRRLSEGGHVRALSAEDEEGGEPWDAALAPHLMARGSPEWSVLCVAGGAASLPRALLASGPSPSVRVIERVAEVVDLGAEHLGTGLAVGNGDRVSVTVGNLEDQLRGLRERFDVVVVDGGGLAALGGSAALSREARARIVQAVSPGGLLLWGGETLAPDRPELAASWMRLHFVRSLADGSASPLTVLWAKGPPPLPTPLEGFEPVERTADQDGAPPPPAGAT